MHTGFYPRLEFAVPFSSRTRPGGKGSPIFDVLLYRRGASGFVAFDLLYTDGRQLISRPLAERRARLLGAGRALLDNDAGHERRRAVRERRRVSVLAQRERPVRRTLSSQAHAIAAVHSNPTKGVQQC